MQGRTAHAGARRLPFGDEKVGSHLVGSKLSARVLGSVSWYDLDQLFEPVLNEDHVSGRFVS